MHIPPTYGSTIAKLDSNSTRRPNNSRSVAELPANLDLAAAIASGKVFWHGN